MSNVLKSDLFIVSISILLFWKQNTQSWATQKKAMKTGIFFHWLEINYRENDVKHLSKVMLYWYAMIWIHVNLCAKKGGRHAIEKFISSMCNVYDDRNNWIHFHFFLLRSIWVCFVLVEFFTSHFVLFLHLCLSVRSKFIDNHFERNTTIERELNVLKNIECNYQTLNEIIC